MLLQCPPYGRGSTFPLRCCSKCNEASLRGSLLPQSVAALGASCVVPGHYALASITHPLLIFHFLALAPPAPTPGSGFYLYPILRRVSSGGEHAVTASPAVAAGDCIKQKAFRHGAFASCAPGQFFPMFDTAFTWMSQSTYCILYTCTYFTGAQPGSMVCWCPGLEDSSFVPWQSFWDFTPYSHITLFLL